MSYLRRNGSKTDQYDRFRFRASSSTQVVLFIDSILKVPNMAHFIVLIASEVKLPYSFIVQLLSVQYFIAGFLRNSKSLKIISANQRQSSSEMNESPQNVRPNCQGHNRHRSG